MLENTFINSDRYSHFGDMHPYLAVRTVVHLEQSPSALAAQLQVVGGIDDLDAEMQSLKEKLPWHPWASDLISQDAGRPAKRSHVTAGRPQTLGIARRYVAEAWVDEVIVDKREEGVEESLH